MSRRALLGGLRKPLVTDLVSGFIHGYSTARKLRSLYSGNGIRIREQGGSLSEKIGFVNGIIDEALIAATGSGLNMLLNIMYDQVGGRDLLTGSGSFAGAVIKNSSNVITKVSDRVYAQYNGTNSFLTTSSTTPITDKDCTVFVVFESQSGESNQTVFQEFQSINNRVNVNSNTQSSMPATTTNYAPDGTSRPLVYNTQQPQSTKRCFILQRASNVVYVYDDSGGLVDSVATSATFTANTTLELGKVLINLQFFSGKIAELLINNTALSTTDRNTVLDNIKDFYSIV